MRQGENGKILYRIVFPLVLLAFPLLLVNQGIDITDTTYSLGYYRFMEEMDVTWVLATYLANVTGAFFMKLPMGDTLLGMNAGLDCISWGSDCTGALLVSYHHVI